MLPDKARERAREIKTAAQLGRDLIAAERAAREQEEVATARNLRAVLVRFAAFANDRFILDRLSLRLPTSYDLRLCGLIRSRDHAYTLDEAAALWIGAGEMGRRGALARWILLTACRRIEAQFVE
jgi:hypothetical protein